MPEEKPARRTRGKPNEIDAHVGSRVRERRLLLGMSQERLADAMGLTFQQVQKYERGANRIGAGRLYSLSLALAVPTDYFFVEAPLPKTTRAVPEALAAAQVTDPMGSRETRKLVSAYYGINDPRSRAACLAFAKALAGERDMPDDVDMPSES